MREKESFHVNPLDRDGKITLCPSDVILDVTCQIMLQNKSPYSLFFRSFISTHKEYINLLLFFFSLSISFSLPPGPGPVDTPAVSGLHPRSLTITWVPPSQPNGIITNYTLYLCPSSVSSLDFKPSSVYCTNTTLNSSLGPNPRLLPSTEGPYLNSGHNLRPSLRPGIAEESTNGSNTSQSPIFISFHPTEPSTANINPSRSFLLSNPQYNAASSNTEHVLKQEPFHSPISGSFGAASDSTSSPLSVTVPGNTTSYTFLDLLPYQTYSIQVQYYTMILWWNTIRCHIVRLIKHYAI